MKQYARWGGFTRTKVTAAALAALVLPIAWASTARAEDTTVVNVPQTQPVAEHSSYTGPNRALIATGLVTFGVTYIPSVIVAGTSGQSADHHLYVPVVGPWLDLADRPQCGAGSIACDTETTNKVLIVGSGVLQGLGVLTTVVGFLVPERTTTVVTARQDKPTVHVTPAQMGSGGYGVAAFGDF